MKNEPTAEPIEHHSEFDVDAVDKPTLAGHGWIQMGFQLICQTCQREHAVFLKPGYMYHGNDEKGVPIVKKQW